MVFFSAAGRPVLPLSFSVCVDLCQVNGGGAPNRRMAARMVLTIGPVTATSAKWKGVTDDTRPDLDQLALAAGERPVGHDLGT